MLILVAILGIGLLIMVHELGHFLAAKSFGMLAEKFYIGFPPAALKKKIGETEYGIGIIPLGGYVKIAGMTREEKVPPGMESRAYFAKPIWQRIITIGAGPLMNVTFAALLFFAVFYFQGLPEYAPTTNIAVVQPGSGAEAAGIQVGDKLLSVAGVSSDDPEVIRSQLQSRPDQQVAISFERDGERQTVTALVGRQAETGQGLLGIAFDAKQVGTEKLSLGESLRHTVSDIGFITKEVFIAIKNLFVSESSREELSSPIGIVAVSSQTIELGWSIYVRVLGFISLQLAIFNLLPLLPLDGGHVVFNLIEKVKGSPIRKEVFEKASAVGLVLFATLFLMGLFNDIQRLLGPGFSLQP